MANICKTPEPGSAVIFRLTSGSHWPTICKMTFMIFRSNFRTIGIAALYILLTAATNFAYATNCNDVRLDGAGTAFNDIPVYNQLDSLNVDANLCYAIASSQLIDEFRFRNGDPLKQLSSPISLAIGYKSYSQDKSNLNYRIEPIDFSQLSTSLIGGGFIEETLQSANAVNICDQRFVENVVGLVNQNKTNALSKFVSDIFISKNAQGAQSLKFPSFNKIDYLRTLVSEFEKQCLGNSFNLPQINFESLSPGNYLDDLQKLVKDQLDSSLGEAEKLNLRQAFAKKYRKEDVVKAFQNKIDSLLNRKIPVGVGYFMKALKMIGPNDSYSSHASVITGQRTNPQSGVCELLVRNSYGSDCKDRRGDDRYGRSCENGSIWVPADELLSDTFKISWIP
jgi:hypothetical protein